MRKTKKVKVKCVLDYYGEAGYHHPYIAPSWTGILRLSQIPFLFHSYKESEMGGLE